MVIVRFEAARIPNMYTALVEHDSRHYFVSASFYPATGIILVTVVRPCPPEFPLDSLTYPESREVRSNSKLRQAIDDLVTERVRVVRRERG